MKTGETTTERIERLAQLLDTVVGVPGVAEQLREFTGPLLDEVSALRAEKRIDECAGAGHVPLTIKTVHEIDDATGCYPPISGICWCGTYEWTATKREASR